MSFSMGGLSVSDMSAAGMLLLVVLFILLGYLVPRRVVKDLVRQRDVRIEAGRAETENWQKAYLASERARELQGEQLRQQLELAKTTDQFIRTLQHAALSQAPSAPILEAPK